MEGDDIQEEITPLTVLDTASLHLVHDHTIITDAQIITADSLDHHHHHLLTAEGHIVSALEPGTIQVLLPVMGGGGEDLASAVTAAVAETAASNIPFSIADIVSQTAKSAEIEEEAQGIELSDGELDEQKKAIYNHPMLPLVHLFFEKCEHATQLNDLRDFDEEPTLAENFPSEVAIYINAKEGQLQSDNPELDDLMLKAIKVLQIHLLELEKVRELCKDFCSRYITCLKSKLQNEQLLHVEGVEDDLDPNAIGSPQVEEVMEVCNEVILGTDADTLETTGTIYQMVQTPQGVVAQPVSYIEPVHKIQTISKKRKSIKVETDWQETPKKGGKTKRGVLPKAATQIMKTWLFQHIIHPYPTEDEKRVISAQTNLSMLQVNNWFINARRRILTPMMENSQHTLNAAKGIDMHKAAPKKLSRTPSRSSNSWLKATKMDDIPDTQEIDYAADSIVLPPGVTLTTDGQIITLQHSMDDNNIVVVSTEAPEECM